MKQGFFKITENIKLTPTTWRMKLEGDVSGIKAPGQFINIKLDGHFLRRPISICDARNDEITIIYKVLGHGTEEMTCLTPGAELDVLTGLGNGYDLSDAGDRPLLIGGFLLSLIRRAPLCLTGSKRFPDIPHSFSAVPHGFPGRRFCPGQGR